MQTHYCSKLMLCGKPSLVSTAQHTAFSWKLSKWTEESRHSFTLSAKMHPRFCRTGLPCIVNGYIMIKMTITQSLPSGGETHKQIVKCHIPCVVENSECHETTDPCLGRKAPVWPRPAAADTTADTS